MSSSSALVAFVAGLHRGYIDFFRAHRGSVLYVLGEDFVADFTALKRHLPAPKPEDVRAMLQGLGIFKDVRVLTKDRIEDVLRYGKLIMPDEDVSHVLATEYFSSMKVEFDGSWRLRWDWGSSQKNERPQDERVVSTAELDRTLMRKAYGQAARSSDWWRQVGGLLVRNGKVLIAAYNKHMPTEHTLYLYGDPRSNFEQGCSIEMSGASHAERRIIAIAAREGIAMIGCDLYVTTFPCPPCAYQVAETGIARLFYSDGYSSLEGANSLSNIEIVRVEMEDAPVPA